MKLCGPGANPAVSANVALPLASSVPLPTTEPSTRKSTEPVGVPNVAVTLAESVIGAFAVGLAGANDVAVVVGEGLTSS